MRIELKIGTVLTPEGLPYLSKSGNTGPLNVASFTYVQGNENNCAMFFFMNNKSVGGGAMVYASEQRVPTQYRVDRDGAVSLILNVKKPKVKQ